MDSVSEDGAKQVLSQLERQGYFLNQNARTIQATSEDDSFEAYQQWKQRHEKDQSNTSSYLISPIIDEGDGDSYFTPVGLVRHLIGRLHQSESSGRASLSELCREARVDCQLFSATLPTSKSEGTSSSLSLWDHLERESTLSSVTILGTNKRGAIQSVELVSVAYWERTLEEIIEMVEQQGKVSISNVMSMYSLPREAILDHLIAVGDGKEVTERMRLMNDSKELVSTSQYHSLRLKVLKYFSSLDEPIQINDVCQQERWELNQVVEWLTTQLENQNENNETSELYLQGEIHTDAGTCGQTAMYLPTSYRERQQKDILDFISANGYITMERATRNYRHGLLATQISALINDSFPGVTILNEGTVFVTESILQQVQVGVQSYLASSTAASGLLDLQEYLPEELLQSCNTVQNILDSVGFASPADGVAVIGNDRALLASREAIQKFKDTHLSQLVQKHAKNRASELFQLQFAMDEDENEDDGGQSGKSTRNRRKAKQSKQNKKRDKIPKGDSSSFMVPLADVVLAVIDAFSDFQEDSADDMKGRNLDWEDDNDDSVLVAEFCRNAFYSDSLVEQCQRAVNAELQRLESEKNSKAKMSRKDAAAKVRSVEAAFQDAFVTLCYLIQAQAKTIAHFTNLEDSFDEESLELLKDEFLQGPCADLTSRITQHCLFQEEAEEDCLFTFVKTAQDNRQEETVTQSSNLPRYCSDVTVTSRCHEQSYLSCAPPREPLPVLRESFSGNSGIVLAKMWILCGGECYRGGIRTIYDDEGGVGSQSVHVRPGNMDGFLSFAEENCLTLCGLPYKKLDKKAEKSLMFSRKQQLNALLAATDATTDPIKVLEYTIMILFQQVRSLIVSGSMLRGSMMEALSKERKIPSSVAAALKLLNEMIENGNTPVNGTLVSLVKECGLVRDISKHDTTPIESFLSDS